MPSCLAPFLQCLPNRAATTEEDKKPSTTAATPAAESKEPASNTAAPAAAATATPVSVPATTPATMSSQAKIAVVIWSLYGHIATLSDSVVEGLKEANVEYKVFQFTETLPDEVLQKMHANKAPIQSLPEITPEELKEFDGFVLGFPTRYGRAPAQVSTFFDRCGGLWATGGLVGKFATIFTSTASQHGGLETTQLTTIPFLAHQGVIFVPLGYQDMASQGAVDGIIGSSAYGAGTIAGGQGQLQPDPRDLQVAKKQGSYFANIVSAYKRGAASA